MLAAGSGTDATVSQQQPRVVFVVTVRNNPALLERCLRSVADQTYPQLRCIVVDDASDDTTSTVATRWAADRSDLITAYLESAPRGKMANFNAAVVGLDPDEVVAELDGDDQLLTCQAAADIARLHTRLDLVWTQHRIARGPVSDWPHFRSTDLPPAYRAAESLPRLPWSRTWHPSHLRTFKAWAYHQIDRDDLMLDGAWLQVCADLAYYSPLVEMTPPHLRYFYDRELVLYNVTPHNDRLADHDGQPPYRRQSYVAQRIVERPAYRVHPAPLWIGELSTANRPAIERFADRQLRSNRATRFLLASGPPMPQSWHPRVQVVARHTLTGPTGATATWSDALAAELGYQPNRAAADGLPLHRYG